VCHQATRKPAIALHNQAPNRIGDMRDGAEDACIGACQWCVLRGNGDGVLPRPAARAHIERESGL
jgi:hypothetical protein